MCFAYDARPPDLPAGLALPPIAGGAGAEVLELTSADGTRFSAALAESPGARRPGRRHPPGRPRAVPLLRRAGRALRRGRPPRDRLDYFGRTAGLGPRDEDFDYMPHVRRPRSTRSRPTSPPPRAPCASAPAPTRRRHRRLLLRRHAVVPGRDEPELGLAGVVGFYGGLDGARRGLPAPARARRREMRGPVLGLFGGADQAHPARGRRGLRRGLDAAGVEHEIVVYPGAPHSFFDRRQDEFADASADAWRRTLGFLGGRQQAAGAATSVESVRPARRQVHEAGVRALRAGRAG